MHAFRSDNGFPLWHSFITSSAAHHPTSAAISTEMQQMAKRGSSSSVSKIKKALYRNDINLIYSLPAQMDIRVIYFPSTGWQRETNSDTSLPSSWRYSGWIRVNCGTLKQFLMKQREKDLSVKHHVSMVLVSYKRQARCCVFQLPAHVRKS
jgi:hypothetical protein